MYLKQLYNLTFKVFWSLPSCHSFWNISKKLCVLFENGNVTETGEYLLRFSEDFVFFRLPLILPF